MTGNPHDCVATCRPGLETVVAEELQSLGIAKTRRGKRSVRFEAGPAELYRVNMGLRAAIQVLVELRRFRARTYEVLYHQARRTNWHHLFTPDKPLRIDVNGRSPHLRNSQYVVHRIKDGIVDTFRKLHGQRPDISKREPEIHVVAHLEGDEVSLCFDSSGIPLFKRGYRREHGEAPLKEDLAAGILLMSGVRDHAGLVDPCCGGGTFCFEGWMIACGVYPNLRRDFAFTHWLDYNPRVHQTERDKLAAKAEPHKRFSAHGADRDAEAVALCEKIRSDHFPEAAGLDFHCRRLQEAGASVPGGLLVANPPYGKRLGSEPELVALYRDLSWAARCRVPGGGFSLFTANRAAAKQIPLKPAWTRTLFNGALEGLLLHYRMPEEKKAAS
ncbi:MAG: hypothetical protein GVY10_08965 [Verrucomicrobia bacterium]|jgi:23S rRNA G2445 N2-methylase RlmL|nr:hypothetical protein [Verrucomicrobiota bacterium]